MSLSRFHFRISDDHDTNFLKVTFDPQCILVADHHGEHAETIRHVLEQERISNTVQVVARGEELIAYLTGSDRYSDRTEYPLPCFVLLDLAMEGAFDALIWIRAHPDFRRLPVVVLTHSREADHISRVYALGANSYLIKPFDQAKLRELVKAINAYWVILVQKPSFR